MNCGLNHRDEFWTEIKECTSNVTSCKASHLQEYSWHTQAECTEEDLTGVRQAHTCTHLMLVMLPVSEPSLHLSNWLATICRSASSSLVRRSNCNSWRERERESERVSKHAIYLLSHLQSYWTLFWLHRLRHIFNCCEMVSAVCGGKTGQTSLCLSVSHCQIFTEKSLMCRKTVTPN